MAGRKLVYYPFHIFYLFLDMNFRKKRLSICKYRRRDAIYRQWFVSTCSVFVPPSLCQSLSCQQLCIRLASLLTDLRAEDQQLKSSCLFCFILFILFCVCVKLRFKAGPSQIRFWHIWHNRKSRIFVHADLILAALDTLAAVVVLIASSLNLHFMSSSFHFCEWNVSHIPGLY